MSRNNENKRRIIGICLFLALFIVGTIFLLITPTSIRITYGNVATTSDGESISYNLFEPVGRESEFKPLILIGHGFMANKEIMKGYAVELAAAGFLAAAFDFRGHGQSSGVLEQDKLINDVIAVQQDIRKRGDVHPMAAGYIGYSMGGSPGNKIIKDYLEYQCFIGVGTGLITNASEIRWGNSSLPLNVLMIQAKFDEAIDLASQKAGVGFRLGLSASDVDVNKLYGSFEDGDATMIFYDDNTDHLLLAWDQDFIREARNWVINTFPWVRPVDEDFYVNVRGLILVFQCIGGIGLFFLILEPLSDLIVKAKEEDRYKIEIQDETIKSLSIKTIGYTLGLSLIGMIMAITLFLFLPLSIAGMMGLFLFGSAVSLVIMLWRIGKNSNLSLIGMIKGAFKRPQGQLLREIVLGVMLAAILYVIIYLSTGLNYFAMIPYFIKVLWMPPYYAVYFFVFLMIGLAFHCLIQVKFQDDLKNTCKVALLGFGFQIVYFVVYILLLSILMRSTFFMLTYIIAVPMLTLTSFSSTFLYQKTGNIITGAIVTTTLFVGIIGTLSPFFMGINMLSMFIH